MFKIPVIDQSELSKINLTDCLLNLETQNYLDKFLLKDCKKVETASSNLQSHSSTLVNDIWHNDLTQSCVIVRKIPHLLNWQESFEQMVDFTQNRNESTLDQFLLLEHEPVFTQGQTADLENNILGHDVHIPILQADRGGQVTYHGPQQQIVYLLIDFNRKKHFFEQFGVKFYARNIVSAMEDAVVNILAHFGISDVHARPDAPGIYVQDKKISSLGLKVTKHGTYHGIAINLDMDLTPFKLINPCGYSGLEMCNVSDYVKLDNFKYLNTITLNTKLNNLTLFELIKIYVSEYFISYLAHTLSYQHLIDFDKLVQIKQDKID